MSEYIGWLDEDWNTVLDQSQEIVRCRDCKHLDAIRTSYSTEPVFQCMADWCQGIDGDSPFVEPDGFCAWGERRFITCKCGEEIELGDREYAVCPSCGRTVSK